MTTFVILYITSYILTFIITLGWGVAYWQGKFSAIAKMYKTEDYIFSLLVSASLYGPLGILQIYLLTNHAEYGWSVK